MVDTRCGYAAIVGMPNAGKSTLLNALVGSKLAIVTPKPQTTRNRILGICMQEKAQIIFVDTPGIFAADQPFEKAMVASAWAGATEADIVLVMVDAVKGIHPGVQAILDELKKHKKKAVVALNKIDAIQKHELLKLADELNKTGLFEAIFMISALTGEGLEQLKIYLGNIMPEGPWLFPDDQLSDTSQRLLASEITREKLFMALQEELPYSLTVETEKWEEDEKNVKIHQIIIVQKEGQKKIVIGKGGSMLKSVGESARKELTRMLGKKAHVFLFVKVREDWKEKPDAYHYLGLEFKQ